MIDSPRIQLTKARLTKDPEIHAATNGVDTYMVIDLAVNPWRKDRETGESIQADPQFYQATIWDGALIDAYQQSLFKGTSVTVTGYLNVHYYLDSNGQQRTQLQINNATIALRIERARQTPEF